MSSSTDSAGNADHPTLRTDAQRNRARILTAAREAFADQGLDVAMAEVARRADVGIATLYRRFPTREDLITATFTDKMTAYAEAAEAALNDLEPWRGFCEFVERVCAMQADDHGFTRVLTMTFSADSAFEAERDRAYNGFALLIEQAKQTGRLRPDFQSEDLVLLLMANAGVISATGEHAPHAWRRLVAYMVQAFASEHTAELPSAPAADDLHRAMAACSSPRKHPFSAG